MKQEKIKSYLMLITSMLLFGSIGIFRRNVNLSSGFIAMVRGLLGSFILLIFTSLKHQKLELKMGKADIVLLSVSGISMGLNWILLFEAYEYTTVANATMCYYMMPTIVILLSPFIFKEKLSSKKLICAITGILGIGLISGINPNSTIELENPKGYILGLSAALLYAIVVILNKCIKTKDVYLKTIIQLFLAGIVLFPYLIFSGQLISLSATTSDVVLLLIMGIVHTGIAYMLYFSSIKNLNANSVAILSYIDPVFALLLSAFFMDEPMSTKGIIGSTLIVTSAIISELTPKSKA